MAAGCELSALEPRTGPVFARRERGPANLSCVLTTIQVLLLCLLDQLAARQDQRDGGGAGRAVRAAGTRSPRAGQRHRRHGGQGPARDADGHLPDDGVRNARP
eukprot:7030538-Prymnesium_polylepis.1